MDWLDVVIKIGAGVTTVIGLWKIITKVIHSIDDIKTDIKELKDHSKENYLGIKRLTVMSHDMPIGERIVAGDDYIKAGGNGDVKHYIENELHTKEIRHD